MTTHPPLEMTIRTDADLAQLWTRLMGPGGFGRRSIWLTFLDARSRTQPVIVPIDDVPAEPDDALLASVSSIVRGLITSGDTCAVAILLSRPGAPAMTASDKRWALALQARLGEFSPWPVHLATADRIRVFAPDDLIAGSCAP